MDGSSQVGSMTDNIQSIKFFSFKKCENCETSIGISFNPILKKDLCSECDLKLSANDRKVHPEKYLRYCGVPNEYLRCSFENYIGNEKLIEAFKRYCNNPRSLMLYGNCGSGKTHIAIAVMNEFIKRNISLKKIYFLPTRKLIYDIKSSYSNDYLHQETEQSILERYSKIKFLVLDDFGYDEQPSNNHINIIYSLLDERINNATITLLTTNLNLEMIEQKFGLRIASRLSTFLQYKLTMPDYRRKRIMATNK